MKNVHTLYDQATSTLTYIVYDEQTRDAIVIDPVLNYEPQGATYSYESISQVQTWVQENNVKLHLCIDTHAHADHISGCAEIKKRFPTLKTVIGAHIIDVQKTFKDIFHVKSLPTDGQQFDMLIEDGQVFHAGSIEIKAIHTPGHTPTCTSYVIEDMIFTGDALFMPDFGTGRCDFPLGSAKDLYFSVHEKLYKLDDKIRVFVGHDYQPGGRELAWETTIGDSKKNNIHLREETSEEEFVTFREKRDKTLNPPKLLLPSIQVNIDAGRFPDPEANGVSYLKLPLREKK